MIHFYQNSFLGYLMLLDLIMRGLAAHETSPQLFPSPFQVCGLWHLGSGTIQMQRHVAQDEGTVIRYQFQSMSHCYLFSFSLVTLRSFCAACSLKITLFFFKEENYAIAIMLLLGLLTGHCCNYGLQLETLLLCLRQRRKKLLFLVEKLHSGSKHYFLRGEFSSETDFNVDTDIFFSCLSLLIICQGANQPEGQAF